MSTLVTDISDEEMNSLTQSIFARYGIDFTCYEPKSLRRRIIRIINRFNFTSIPDLWVRFLKDSGFLQVFMNEVSVGMTSMFRDPVLWKRLKHHIEKDYSSSNPISIWHAGCSTGEEVYSLGILLQEMNISHRAKALATDFNKDAIDEARNGVYHKIKMIETENNFKTLNPFHDFSKYYTSDGKHHAIMDPNLVKHATFEYQNLITDPYPQGYDIIFCRNVMIYFDTPAKTKILEKFHKALNPNGILIIGFFDTMSHLIDSKKFQLLDQEAKIFRKTNSSLTDWLLN
jgi:chemotaxis protein methyltransferase CheR